MIAVRPPKELPKELVYLTAINVGNDDYDYYFTNYLPSYLDVELGVLDPRAVAQFRARLVNPTLAVQVGNPGAWSYLTNHVGSIHLFKQRIPIRNSPTDAP